MIALFMIALPLFTTIPVRPTLLTGQLNRCVARRRRCAFNAVLQTITSPNRPSFAGFDRRNLTIIRHDD
jgi:hypothetical protein